MAFEPLLAVRAIHLIGATLWIGGVMQSAFISVPILNSGSPVAMSFLAAIMRRGGYGRYFAPIAIVTVASGAYLYIAAGYGTAPFGSASAVALTFGGLLAVLALVVDVVLVLPLERRMVKMAQEFPKEGLLAAVQVEALHQQNVAIGRRIVWAGPPLFLAFLLMLARPFLA